MKAEQGPPVPIESGVEEQEGAEIGDKDIQLYEDLRMLAEQEKDSKMELLLQNMEKAAMQYAQTADANEYWWRRRLDEGLDPEEMGQADLLEQRRTASHEVLIDSLNALSRLCRDLELDNSWRNDIGLERTKVGLWGRKVARHIKNKLLKEESNGKVEIS